MSIPVYDKLAVVKKQLTNDEKFAIHCHRMETPEDVSKRFPQLNCSYQSFFFLHEIQFRFSTTHDQRFFTTFIRN